MVCHGEVENQILFRAIGGVLAGTAAIIPLIAFRQIRKYPAVVMNSALSDAGWNEERKD